MRRVVKMTLRVTGYRSALQAQAIRTVVKSMEALADEITLPERERTMGVRFFSLGYFTSSQRVFFLCAWIISHCMLDGFSATGWLSEGAEGSISPCTPPSPESLATKVEETLGPRLDNIEQKVEITTQACAAIVRLPNPLRRKGALNPSREAFQKLLLPSLRLRQTNV
jgi:hypothetical protein